MIAIRKLSCPTFSGQNPGITAKLRNVSTTRRVRQASCSCRWWGHSETALDALILRERAAIRPQVSLSWKLTFGRLSMRAARAYPGILHRTYVDGCELERRDGRS